MIILAGTPQRTLGFLPLLKMAPLEASGGIFLGIIMKLQRTVKKRFSNDPASITNLTLTFLLGNYPLVGLWSEKNHRTFAGLSCFNLRTIRLNDTEKYLSNLFFRSRGSLWWKYCRKSPTNRSHQFIEWKKNILRIQISFNETWKKFFIPCLNFLVRFFHPNFSAIMCSTQPL